MITTQLLLWMLVLASGGQKQLPPSHAFAATVVRSSTPAPISTRSGTTALNAEVPTESLDNYHLVWSPGFVQKVTTSTAGLFLVRALTGFSGISSGLSSFRMPGLASNVILPLFASSCCLLQLIVNVIAGGCAGFNTILGPVRPYFLALLVFFTLTRPPALSTSILRWTVALLPEVLHLWNSRRPRRLPPVAASTPTAQIELDIPSMGCVACIANIDAALLDADRLRVRQAVSSLHPLGQKGGVATVEVAAEDDAELYAIVDALIEAVGKAGFDGCTVAAIRKRS